jgi:predicted transposase YbfD/YdcC
MPTAAPLRHLACDGKELRGSHRLTNAGVVAAQGVLGIYDTRCDRMAAWLPIAGKGFEPKALQVWLAAQAQQKGLAGCLLTADALHTQRSVCYAIRRAGADYLLLAKRNQRSLREDIAYLFNQVPDFWFPERRTRQVKVGHGRREHSLLRASDELNGYLADRWPGVQQVFQLERTVTRRSRHGVKTTTEFVYGFTSVPASRASPAQLLAWLRSHWRIENRSHWRRDATLGEDRLQLASKPAMLVIAVLNCAILALLDRLHVTNCRQAMRHFNAHPEQALTLLCQPV